MACSPMLTLHFVRHGETTANRDGIIQGHQNYDLTPLGVTQAEATAGRLKNTKYWQAHASDLVRASHTAGVILAEHDRPVLVKSQLLREFGLGVLEDLPRGTSRSDACRIKAAKAGVSLEDFVEPQRETKSDVEKRAQQFLDALIADAAKDASREREGGASVGGGDGQERGDSENENERRIALVVSHGGLLNVMLSTVMEFGCDIGFMNNCAVATVEVFEKEGAGVSFVSRGLNDDSHMVAAGLGAGKHVENFSKVLDEE